MQWIQNLKQFHSIYSHSNQCESRNEQKYVIAIDDDEFCDGREEKKNNNDETTNCFVEWKWTRPNLGSQKFLIIQMVSSNDRVFMSFDRHNTNIYLLTNYTNNVRNTWQPTHTHPITNTHIRTHPITHKFLEMKTAKLTHFKYYLFVPWIWLLVWKNEDRITTVDPQHTFKTVIYCVFDISNHNNYRHHSHHPFDIINSNNMNMLASMCGTTERWKDLTSLLFYLFFFLPHYSFSLFLGEIFFSINIINRCDLH